MSVQLETRKYEGQIWAWRDEMNYFAKCKVNHIRVLVDLHQPTRLDLRDEMLLLLTDHVYKQ